MQGIISNESRAQKIEFRFYVIRCGLMRLALAKYLFHTLAGYTVGSARFAYGIYRTGCRGDSILTLRGKLMKYDSYQYLEFNWYGMWIVDMIAIPRAAHTYAMAYDSRRRGRSLFNGARFARAFIRHRVFITAAT